MKHIGKVYLIISVFFLIIGIVFWVFSIPSFELFFKISLFGILTFVSYYCFFDFYIKESLSEYGASCARVAAEYLIKNIDKDETYYKKTEKEFEKYWVSCVVDFGHDNEDLESKYYRKSQFFTDHKADPDHINATYTSKITNIYFQKVIQKITLFIILSFLIGPLFILYLF